MIRYAKSFVVGVWTIGAFSSCTGSEQPCAQDADCFDDNVCFDGSCTNPANVPSSGSGGSSGASTSSSSSSSSGSGAGGSSDDCVTPKDYSEYHVDKSVMICPRTYYGTKILLDASGITVGGSGVTLNYGKNEPAIEIHNVHNTHIYGFEVRNCGYNGAVSIWNGSNNRLAFLKISTPEMGIGVTNGANNRIEDVEVVTERINAMVIADSPYLTILRSKFRGGSDPESFWGSMIQSVGDSPGVYLYDLDISLLTPGTAIAWSNAGNAHIESCTISGPAHTAIAVSQMSDGRIGDNVITMGSDSSDCCISLTNSTNSRIYSNTLEACTTFCWGGCDQNGNEYYNNTELY